MPYILRYTLGYAALLGVIAFATIDHTLRATAPQSVIPATLTFTAGAAVLGTIMWWLVHSRSTQAKIIGNAIALIGAGTLIYTASWAEAVASAACWGVGLLLLFAVTGISNKKKS